MKKTNNTNLKVVDFFCSAGGVTCGFKQAGINILGGIDIDPNCKVTYEKNNNAKYLCADVSHLNIKSLTKIFKIRRNQSNLIFVGCSPCQYYSNMNTDKTKATETRLLLDDFQLFVDYYKPGYIFVENLPGLKRDTESPLGKFKKFLSDNGYVFDDGIVNAKYFGVPQNRRRYVLIATRVKEDIKLPTGNKKNIKTVKAAIGDYSKYYPISSGHKDTSTVSILSSPIRADNTKELSLR